MRTLAMAAAVTVTVVAATGLGLPSAHAQPDGKFKQVRVYFEQNLTDKDAEVVFDAKGGDEGLRRLTVKAPDGRTVIDFSAADSALGIRHLILESPEPKNDGRIQKDFPEGVYKFAGETVSGARLEGEATLSHAGPAPVRFLRPKPEEKGLPVTGLRLGWSPVKDTAHIMVELKHKASGRWIKVNLPGDATAVAIPDGFLKPGTHYALSIGTVTKEGNTSFTDAGFTTVAQAGPGEAKTAAKVISEDEARAIASKAVAGTIRNVAIEKKLGAHRYVVEVEPAGGGKEIDVVIHMTSGKVLALEK
jgi:hypothetical protein